MAGPRRVAALRHPIAYAVADTTTMNASTTKNNHVPTTTTWVRTYRGDSGEAVHPVLSPEEEALVKVAQPKAEEIFARHIELPPDGLDTRRKRLVYRSKQRGWLEVDLLLGTWASENVHQLTGDELDQYENFVNMETIDIYNVITLRLDVPEHMKREGGRGVVERIQEWARSNPLGRADPDAYKSIKTEHKLI
jgi:succinate dehydrogenase flavin-adding protein (antitoxin of CptAB toxin-antitoxin module)